MTVLARVSLTALRANLARSGADGGVVDVRADGWGHGAVTVAAAAVASGGRQVIADADQHDELRAAGIPSDALVDVGAATVDPLAVFGLDGIGVPVLRLCGEVVTTKDLRAGEGVSYGYLHRAPHDTRIALVSGGYGQGVYRALGERASVVISGRRCAILGRVAMDVCVVEIGDAPLSRGADVWFFGDPAQGHPSVHEWADASGLSAAELVAAVGLHAERRSE